MKIVFFGTPDFAVDALQALLQEGHTVTAVVTQPDKAKGRSKTPVFSPVKECAVKAGIPVLQPARVKRPEAVEALRAYEADVFVVAAFGQILSKEILDMPRFGCLNIHASLLPAYRGASPIQWAVINGEEKTGVTVQQIREIFYIRRKSGLPKKRRENLCLKSLLCWGQKPLWKRCGCLQKESLCRQRSARRRLRIRA